jgi:hypothetical protein
MKGKKEKGMSSESLILKETQGLLISAQAELLRIDGLLFTATRPQIDEFDKYFAAIRK